MSDRLSQQKVKNGAEPIVVGAKSNNEIWRAFLFDITFILSYFNLSVFFFRKVLFLFKWRIEYTYFLYYRYFLKKFWEKKELESIRKFMTSTNVNKTCVKINCLLVMMIPEAGTVTRLGQRTICSLWIKYTDLLDRSTDLCRTTVTCPEDPFELINCF